MSKKPYVSARCKVFHFLGDVFERIKKQVARTEIVTCPITARSFPDWGVCWIPFRVVCRPQLPGCRVVRQSCVLVRVSSRRGRFDGFFRLRRSLLQGGFAAIGPKEVSDDTFSSRKIVIFRGMFSRCCIGLLLLSLLPAFLPARETAPRIDLRHGVRPDTIRLKAEDLKLGLPCDSVYLKRRDSLRRNDSLRRQAEQRNQRLYDSIRSKTTRRAVPRLLYRMLFVNPVLDTTANGRVLFGECLQVNPQSRLVSDISEIDPVSYTHLTLPTILRV